MEGLSDWNWVIQCVVQLVVGHVPRLGEVPRAPALGTCSELSRTRRPSWDSESILAFATLGGAERHASRSIFRGMRAAIWGRHFLKQMVLLGLPAGFL